MKTTGVRWGAASLAQIFAMLTASERPMGQVGLMPPLPLIAAAPGRRARHRSPGTRAHRRWKRLRSAGRAR